MVIGGKDRIEAWIFDLDNTLYHPSARLLEQIDQRITAFIMQDLAVDRAEADRIRAEYWAQHGITLHGLIANHGTDPEAFLEKVHDVDLAGLSPDPELAAALRALPGRKIVHTNSHRSYARRVLAALGLAGEFEAVYAIEDKDLIPKPQEAAYWRILWETGIDPTRAVMFEDTAANLAVPKRLGMGTVWLAHDPDPVTPDYVDLRLTELRPYLSRLV